MDEGNEPAYPRARVGGFELGMFASYDDCGDAWVSGPDGRVAGLVWASGGPTYFRTLIEPDEQRWGTYAVQLPLPMTTDDEAVAYLTALLPELLPKWEAGRD